MYVLIIFSGMFFLYGMSLFELFVFSISFLILLFVVLLNMFMDIYVLRRKV